MSSTVILNPSSSQGVPYSQHQQRWPADLWPCEDFVTGSVTLVLLVVGAWTAGEDLQVSGKALTPSLLRSECIKDTQDFIK